MPSKRFRCAFCTLRVPKAHRNSLARLEHALNPSSDSSRFVFRLTPSNAAYPIASREQDLVAASVGLKGAAGAMRLLAVGFDRQALLFPEQVDLQRLAVDAQPDVALRRWDACVQAAPAEARLQQTAQAGLSFVIRAPDIEEGAQVRSAAPAASGEHAIDFTDVELSQHSGLLDQATERLPPDPPCHVDQSPTASCIGFRAGFRSPPGSERATSVPTDVLDLAARPARRDRHRPVRPACPTARAARLRCRARPPFRLHTRAVLRAFDRVVQWRDGRRRRSHERADADSL